jgi:MOSC domain-containing protein YiiM
MKQPSLAELEASLEEIARSPQGSGRLELIVRRPAEDQREVLSAADLDPLSGLAGDTWRARKPNPNPDSQLTLMNARVIARLAQTRERWALAGDQLFVDLDLSRAALPVGTRLKIGTAVIEITAKPHTGCAKFAERFGADALAFVNEPAHQPLNLRGVKARVVQPGRIHTGDAVDKL